MEETKDTKDWEWRFFLQDVASHGFIEDCERFVMKWVPIHFLCGRRRRGGGEAR